MLTFSREHFNVYVTIIFSSGTTRITKFRAFYMLCIAHRYFFLCDHVQQ